MIADEEGATAGMAAPAAPAPTAAVDAVDEAVRGIFASVLKLDGASLDERTSLVEDLAVDSLDALELALRIQDGLAIELREEEFARFRTYGEVLACARELLAARDAAVA